MVCAEKPYAIAFNPALPEKSEANFFAIRDCIIHFPVPTIIPLFSVSLFTNDLSMSLVMWTSPVRDLRNVKEGTTRPLIIFTLMGIMLITISVRVTSKTSIMESLTR